MKNLTDDKYHKTLAFIRAEARKRGRDVMEVCGGCRKDLGHSLNCSRLNKNA